MYMVEVVNIIEDCCKISKILEQLVCTMTLTLKDLTK